MTDIGEQYAGLSRNDLVAILRRLVPESYSAPLEVADGRGWELHTSAAAVLALVSQGLANTQAGWYITQASGARYSTGTVTFSRTDTGGAATVLAGSVVAARGEHWFYTLETAAFADAGATSNAVRIQAVRAGFGYNVPAGWIDDVVRVADGSTIDVDTAGLTVTNAARTTGGKDPALDALGWDRGVKRLPSEDDDSYRDRIRTIADVVTPAAVARLLGAWSQRWGVVIDWAETQAPLMDAFTDDNLYLDDTTCPGLDDIVTSRGAFFVLLPEIGEVYDSDNYLDDDLYTDDDGYLDDWDLAKSQVGAGLLQALDDIKGAGIAIVVWQEGAPAQAPSWFDNYGGGLG